MKKLLTLILLTIPLFLSAQRWQDMNIGLRPNSVQLSMNIRNESVGVIYSHLFQKSVFKAPLGIYAFAMHTIPEGWRLPNYAMYNNYAWEREIGVGMLISLPQSLDQSNVQTMLMIGIVRNGHPQANQDKGLYPGNFAGDFYATTKFGGDIGVNFRMENRVDVHIRLDPINFMRYVKIGAGIAF